MLGEFREQDGGEIRVPKKIVTTRGENHYFLLFKLLNTVCFLDLFTIYYYSFYWHY